MKWEGYEDPTLEPAGNFFHRFSGPLIEYGVKNGVHMNVFKELEGRGTPSRGPWHDRGRQAPCLREVLGAVPHST